MVDYWPTAEADPSATPAMLEFARTWRDKPKLVFSRTLPHVEWNSRLVRLDVVGEVARLRAEPGFHMSVGGPALASSVMRAGLIDEYRLCVHPVILGAGTPYFPALEDRIGLRLLETRTFGSRRGLPPVRAGQPDWMSPWAPPTDCGERPVASPTR
jgi:dihydrofolate reductase